MKVLISQYFSEDENKTTFVFESDGEYEVSCLNTHENLETKFYFSNLIAAENFAEDWVL